MREIRRGSAAEAEMIQLNPLTMAQLATLEAWLVRAPGQAAHWEHYMMAVVHLRHIDGTKDPYKFHPDAQYEFAIMALDPNHAPNVTDPNSLVPLQPINLMVQFKTSLIHPNDPINDKIARDVLRSMVDVVVQGLLPVEPLLGSGPGTGHNQHWCIRLVEEGNVYVVFDHKETYIWGITM